MSGVITGQQVYSDVNFGGSYLLSGKVMDGAAAANYRVRLFDQVSGVLVKEDWSDNGYYEFTRLANTTYYVVCHNHVSHKAIIFSDQTPSAM